MADFSKINVNGVDYTVKDETARTTATTAQSTASSAKSTADAAKTAASTAQTTANKVYDIGAEYSNETITFTFAAKE